MDRLISAGPGCRQRQADYSAGADTKGPGRGHAAATLTKTSQNRTQPGLRAPINQAARQYQRGGTGPTPKASQHTCWSAPGGNASPSITRQDQVNKLASATNIVPPLPLPSRTLRARTESVVQSRPGGDCESLHQGYPFRVSTPVPLVRIRSQSHRKLQHRGRPGLKAGWPTTATSAAGKPSTTGG